MLFMYIHTHTVDRCLAGKLEEGKKLRSEMLERFKKENVKVVSYYSSPNEHTGFYIFDVSDNAALQRALYPLTTWGTARLIPVIANQDYAST